VVVRVLFSKRRAKRGNGPWGLKAVEMGVGRGAMGARKRVAAMAVHQTEMTVVRPR
jgi:hypothetical protein